MKIVLDEKEKEVCRKVCEQIKNSIVDIEVKYLSKENKHQSFNGM